MTKMLTEKWIEIFKINFNKPHIYLFKDKEFDKMDDNYSKVYTKLLKNENFNFIIDQLDLFFKDTLDSEDKNRLYNIIKNLK